MMQIRDVLKTHPDYNKDVRNDVRQKKLNSVCIVSDSQNLSEICLLNWL